MDGAVDIHLPIKIVVEAQVTRCPTSLEGMTSTLLQDAIEKPPKVTVSNKTPWFFGSVSPNPNGLGSLTGCPAICGCVRGVWQGGSLHQSCNFAACGGKSVASHASHKARAVGCTGQVAVGPLSKVVCGIGVDWWTVAWIPDCKSAQGE